MKTTIKYILMLVVMAMATACSDFLDEQKPQGILDDNQVKDPSVVEQTVITAYSGFTQAEDINGSFSMWNYDVRSDDAYKGGISVNDGDVYHQLEVQQGVLTTNWNISDMWVRLYNTVSRINNAILVLESCPDSYALKNTRLAEMKFLRAYSHFLLKRLYKNVPFIMNPALKKEEYDVLSNTEYTNDAAWGVIAKELEEAYEYLPVKQADKGRPTKAACAAFLTKVYLYKAYRQDDPASHKVTSINEEDLKMVLKYSDPQIYKDGGFGLEDDIHNNFRPEEQYENGVESIWAIQYSRNDGSTYGNINLGYGLICPNIAGATDGGCDFYKPSQNLVNAFRTDAEGLPLLDNFNDNDYNLKEDNVDPRLFLTVGLTGLPYMFNKDYIMDESASYGRSGKLYGYRVTLKQNVDPALIGQYLIRGGNYWASPMNRIVFRYADVMLERAEALAQLNDPEAIKIVNEIRKRAAGSTQMITDYPLKYGVKFYIKPYEGNYTKEQALKIVKMERRLELAMESERFFDLVRWGEAKKVLDKYYNEESDDCEIYKGASFPENKGEYLPIPFSQISASNGHYTQNIGGW